MLRFMGSQRVGHNLATELKIKTVLKIQVTYKSHSDAGS